MWNLSAKLTQFTKDILAEDEDDEEEDYGVEQSPMSHQMPSPEALAAHVQRQQIELKRLRDDRASFIRHIEEIEAHNANLTRQNATTQASKEEEVHNLKLAIHQERQAHAESVARFESDKGTMAAQLLELQRDLHQQQLLAQQQQQQIQQQQTQLLQQEQLLLLQQEPTEDEQNSHRIQIHSQQTTETSYPQTQTEQRDSGHESGSDQLSSSQGPPSPTPMLSPESITSLEEKKELSKLRTDLSKFRQHLLRVQNEHEEAIEELKVKLEEEKTKSQALQQALDQLLKEREASVQMTKAQEAEAKRLANLQMVMDQMVFEHQEEIEMKTYHLQKEINQLKADLVTANEKCRNLESMIEQNSELQVKLKEVTDECNQKTLELARVMKDHEPLKKAFENTLTQLHDHLKSNQEVVDKRIVTKLIVTYHTDKTQRNAVLEVMSSILNFTDTEKISVGLMKDPNQTNTAKVTAWVSGWFTPPASPLRLGPGSTGARQNSFAASVTPEVLSTKSLSDLWVEFLLQEAQKGPEEGAVHQNTNFNTNINDSDENKNVVNTNSEACTTTTTVPPFQLPSEGDEVFSASNEAEEADNNE